MKKIVQLQYRSSSAGDFAKRLHNEFEHLGISSTTVSLYSDVAGSDIQLNLGKKERLIARLDNRAHEYMMRNANENFGLFSYPLLGTNVAKLAQVQEADVIYLHWVLMGFMNLNHIEQLAKLGKPIVVIMHDMWYLTGGCHYSFDCDKYKNKCHNCQVFQGEKDRDLSTRGFEHKMKFFKKYNNLHFVSPSKWLYECAQESALTKDKPLYHIPNVLDRSRFKPVDKKVAKEILNIGQEEKVILFGAVSVTSPYKGWSYLKSALQSLYQQEHPENTTVVVFGSSNNQAMADSIPFKTRFLGRLHDEYTVALAYNAADVFVAPSLADNLPYTIFESLGCGTPVVAFHTGGIPDLIQHRINGYLARYKDSEDIAEGIQYCLTHDLKVQPPAELDNALSMQKHLELIHSLIAQN